MRNSRLIASTMVLTSAVLGISSCSTECGPVDRSGKAKVSAVSTTVTAPAGGGEEVSEDSGYFPEPGEFYEQLGISGLEQLIEVESTPICSTISNVGTEISISAVPFGLELLEGDETVEWSETSDGAAIMLLPNNPGDNSQCSAAIGTQ